MRDGNNILIFRPDGIIEEKLVGKIIDEKLIIDIISENAEEIPYLTQFEEMKIAFLQDENAKIAKLKPTIRVVEQGGLIDVLCGNILVVGIDEEEYVGLKDFQMDYIKEKVKTGIVASPTPFLIINR